MTLLRLHLGLVLLFLYGPLVVLVALSFNAAGSAAAWTGLSTQWYEALWHSDAARQAALDTTIVALAATLIATTLGTLLALGLEHRRHKPVLDCVTVLPMLLPDVVLAVALLSLYTALQFSLGLHSIVLSHVVFTLAFVCAVVRRRLGHLDWRMLEASEDLGAGGFTTFRRVTLPLIFPGVLAAALLALALSVDEYVMASATAGPDGMAATLPMLAYAMIRAGTAPEVNALGTLFLLVSFTLVFLAQRLSRPLRTG